MSTATAPAIVCPDWCDRTQQEHLESLEFEGEDLPWHCSNDTSGEGWRVWISGCTTLDGRLPDIPDPHPHVMVEADIWSPEDTAQLVAGLQRIGAILEP
jgi:hypothetical protein